MATAKPNIVAIMADDVGIWNLSAYHRGMMGGSTPNIDRLAREGALFTDSRTGGVTGNTAAGVTASGDMYAGHDGNVYKKDGDSWQQYNNGSWNSVNTQQAQDRATQARSTASTSGFDSSQLNRDSAARSEGAQRTNDFSSARSGAYGRSGSCRPSGGGGSRRR